MGWSRSHLQQPRLSQGQWGYQSPGRGPISLTLPTSLPSPRGNRCSCTETPGPPGTADQAGSISNKMDNPSGGSRARDSSWAEAWPGDFEALWLWYNFTILGSSMASEGPCLASPILTGIPGGVSGWAPLTFLTPGPGAAQVAAAGVASTIRPVHTGSVGPTGLWGTYRP